MLSSPFLNSTPHLRLCQKTGFCGRPYPANYRSTELLEDAFVDDVEHSRFNKSGGVEAGHLFFFE